MNANATDATSTMNTADMTPFMLANWTDPDQPMDNVFGIPLFIADGSTMAKNKDDWHVAWSAGGDIQKEAQNLKERMDKTPEGARFIYVATYSTFVVMTEDVIYHDEGVAKLKAWITEFLSYYKSIGGKLDGITLDTEYSLDSISNISKGQFNEIVASSTYKLPDKYDKVDGAGMLMRIQKNSKYPRLRKMLEEQGFVFYEGTDKTELCYMLESNAASYSLNRSIWSKVMTLLKREYLHEAIIDPLWSFYEDAIVSDYDYTNTQSWLKTTGTQGYYKNVTGNSVEIGNTSNLYTYAQRPSKWFYTGSNGGAYPPGYNKAIYEDTSFGAFLLDLKAFKDMQTATDEDGNLNAWITFYDYNYGTNTAGYATNTVSGTHYHTETLYHIGLMNPKPFLGYVYKNDIKTDEAQRRVLAAGKELTTANLNAEKANLTSAMISEMYQDRLQNISDILAELTRVAGASDRKPIPYNSSWNSSFLISGMYAGGRNIWRISPDTTKGMTLEQFKVAGTEDPTFYINGQTVVFPQGKILEEAKIEPYGSCGYWVETPVNVEPVVINDTNRHSKYPAFEETFSETLSASYWSKSGSIEVKDGALTLSAGATLNNNTIPKKITAGDNYAKQQAWEVTFSVNNTEMVAILLSAASSDGVRVNKGVVQYSDNGKFEDLYSISADTTYTLRREMDFANNKSNVYLYDASGNELANKVGITLNGVTAPVSSIGFMVTMKAFSDKLKLDNYKLYPIGVTTDFELYDAATGYRATEETNAGATAYRLSWMNASAQAKKATIVAEFYDGDALVSTKTVRVVIMSPGADGVETEIVPLSEGKSVKLRMETADYVEEQLPDTSGTEKKGLSLGWILLIALGAVLVAAAVTVAIVLVVKKKR